MTPPNDQISDILLGVGFTQNEASVYLANLELGPASVWDISLKSGVKRSNCYLLLGELVAHGFAATTFDGKRTLYTVISPKELAQIVNERNQEFNRSISLLEGLASKSSNKPVVGLFEGVEGVERVYNLTLELAQESEILIYGTAKVQTKYGEFIDEYLEKRVKKGIHVRAILPGTPMNRNITVRDNQELRDTRFFPINKYDQQTEVNIFGDYIAYIAHSEKAPFATLIENAKLAQEERNRFELLWSMAEE